MAEDHSRLIVRCTISGHVFDFNADLGAVAIGKGAACTPCMDRMFSSQMALHPNGERPQTSNKTRKKHEPFRHRQTRKSK